MFLDKTAKRILSRVDSRIGEGPDTEAAEARGGGDADADGGGFAPDPVSSGDPTSQGYGATSQGVVDTIGRNAGLNPGATIDDISKTSAWRSFTDTVKGALSKSFGGLLGLAAGAITGYNQSQIDQVAENLESIGVSPEVSKTAAKDVLDSMSAQIAKDTAGMSEGEKSDYLNSDITNNTINNAFDTGVGTNVKTDFGDGSGTSNYVYDANSRQIWEDYVNTNYDNAFNALQEQAGRIDTATGEQQSLLGRQISGLEEGSTLTPLRLAVGQDKINIIPRASRETATQIADLGQQRLLNESVAAATANPKLNYLNTLKNLAEMERQISAVDKGVSIQERNLEAQEPGILDYAASLAGILNTGFGEGGFLSG